MSNAYLSPILQDAQFNDDGTFLAGGLIWFYEAGTSTPLLAYTTPVADTAWTNPIQLNARGETGGEIWLTAGSSYKMVLEGPPEYGQTHGIVISTFDNISGVYEPSADNSQNWIAFSGTPIYYNTTTFTTSGDQRAIFLKGRRVKMLNSDGTTYYATIVDSSYAGGTTTVLVSPDFGQFVSNLLVSVQYGLIETGPVSSIPVAVQAGSAASGSPRTLWMDYNAGNNTLLWAWDTAVLSNTWPIRSTTAENAATNAFFVTGTAGQTAYLVTKTAGVNDAYLYNNSTDWGITSADGGLGINYNRSSATFSYGGFTFPNPSSTKYIKLPNGLIIQFGQGTASAAGTTVTFATAFPTQCFTVVTTMVGNPALATSANNLTTTAFTAYCSSTNPVSYIALGF